MDLDGLTERGDLNKSDVIADKADELHGLGYVTVDPLLIAGAIGVPALLFADLALRCPERGQHHAVVHANEDFMGGNGVAKTGGEGIGIGLLS